MACFNWKMAAFLVAAFLAASPTWAFTLEQEGNLVASGWPSHQISVDLDPSCANDTVVTGALGAAVAIWSNVPSSNLVLSVGSTKSLGGPITTFTTGSPSFVGGPLIYCDSSFDADFSVPSGKIPGVDVSPTLNCSSGQTFCPIQGGLVVLNAQSSDPDSVDNLQTTDPAVIPVIIAHELGHALGLGHSADVNALMYYDATQKTQLALAQDDVNGISYLYPRNELGGAGVWGCGSIATVGASLGAGGPSNESGSAPGAMELALFFAACYAMVWGFKTNTSMSRASSLDLACYPASEQRSR